MKKLFQKSRKVLGQGGAQLLLKKVYQFALVKIRSLAAWFLRPVIIRKIKQFNAGSSEAALSFTQSSYLGSLIRPGQVKSEFLGLLNIFKKKLPRSQ